MRAIITISVFMVLFSMNAQEVKMKLMYGRVADKHSRWGIDSVRISTYDTFYSTTTSENGSFELNIPRRTRVLYFYQDRYKPVKIRLSPPARRLDISMKTLSYMKEFYGPPTGKFMIGWLPLKLVWGALGIKLEVFLLKKHSLGAYLDWYYAGRQFFGGEQYTGYKIVPCYRYYFRRDAHIGFFAQVSGIVGYFDFAKLNYFNHNQYPYEISKTYILKSHGFGVGGGVSVVMNKSISKHIIFDIYIGYQYFPEDWPKKATKEGIGTTFSHDATWWYIGGPGSEIDIKLTIGGIF